MSYAGKKWMPPAATWAIRALGFTMRVRIRDEAGVLAGRKSSRSMLFAFWHNRILMMPYLYHKYLSRHYPVKVLISPSRDGQLIAEIIANFSLGTVRGSSRKKPVRAMKEMARLLEEEKTDLAITPDGPLGPIYQVQPGIVFLAQEGGYEIVPLRYYLSWKWELKSWDKFQIPLPFCRCDFIIGEPVTVQPGEDLNAAGEKLAERLGRY